MGVLKEPVQCVWVRLGWVHIRYFGRGGLGLRPYGVSLCKSGKVTKALLPHHLVPRCGSACLLCGIAPWA
ncbi:hypothetical protein FQ186_24595, partial [Pseudomonas sp. ANT_H14]